jgi:hypothetical protein
MNFDTNVIGPANINLIGGGNGLQLQQDCWCCLWLSHGACWVSITGGTES